LKEKLLFIFRKQKYRWVLRVAVVSSVVQIVGVGLMVVGFLLEPYMKVGLLPVSIFEEQQQPLYSIPQKEGDIEEFTLLCCMNEFVVQFGSGQGTKGEDDAKQTDGIVVLGQWEVLHQVYALHLSNR